MWRGGRRLQEGLPAAHHTPSNKRGPEAGARTPHLRAPDIYLRREKEKGGGGVNGHYVREESVMRKYTVNI